MTAETSIATEAENATGGFPFGDEQELKSFLERFGANGRTFRDFTQLTPQSMEVIYMVAFNQYNGGRYDEAEKVFRLLSTLNHFEPKYWMGLGASREMQKKYAEALKAYSFLTVLDMRNPVPAFHGAKCFLAMGKTEEAIAGFRAAVFNSKGVTEHADLQRQAEGMLQVLEAKDKN
jgi:secretion system chaperone SscA